MDKLQKLEAAKLKILEQLRQLTELVEGEINQK